MEYWISKIPCLGCWEWWEIALGISNLIVAAGWYFHNLGKSTQLEQMSIINDLKDIRKITAEYHYKIQDPETEKVDFKKAHQEQTDVSIPDLNFLLKQHKEWVVIDKTTPVGKRWLAMSLEADRSIQLIREHGLKKAREHKKKKDLLPNPASRFWENQL